MLVATADRKYLLDATAGGQLVIAVAVSAIVRDLKGRVAEMRASRDLQVKVGGKSYRAVLTPDLEMGGYSIEVPELPGVVTEADDVAEARSMVVDAIKLWLGTTQRSINLRNAR